MAEAEDLSDEGDSSPEDRPSTSSLKGQWIPSPNKMQKIVAAADKAKSKGRKSNVLKACQQVSHKIKNYDQIHRFRKILEKGGRNTDKYDSIRKHVADKYDQIRRIEKKPVHVRDLRIWGFQHAATLGISFIGSPRWVQNIRKELHISSRKVTRYISKDYANPNKKRDVEKALDEWRIETREKMRKYSLDKIVNFDESGVNYEMQTTRTMSDVGEKHTEMVVGSKSKGTHSYTVLISISPSGLVVGPTFLIFQEKPSKPTNFGFGPEVQKEVDTLLATLSGRIVCFGTTSGKSSKEIHMKYIDSLVAVIGNEWLAIKDQWSGHGDPNMYNDGGWERNIETATIPAGCTYLAQPEDVFFFRQV